MNHIAASQLYRKTKRFLISSSRPSSNGPDQPLNLAFPSRLKKFNGEGAVVAYLNNVRTTKADNHEQRSRRHERSRRMDQLFALGHVSTGTEPLELAPYETGYARLNQMSRDG